MESDARHEIDWRIVMGSILGIWAFYATVVSIRAMLMDFPGQNELGVRRIYVTVAGIAITAMLWQMLRPFDRKPLWMRMLAASILALPCAIAIAAINYYFFNVFDAKELMEVERHLPAKHRADITMEIAEFGLWRYFFLIAWASLYLALGFANDVRAAERKAAQFARAAQSAELRALRYQVNPHFLFNTLNSLSALVMRGNKEAAERMIMNLSTFYRTSLSGEPSEDVTLADEIQLQRLYLDIEAVRFPERLTVRIDLPDALANAAIPGLILQPLVENAIKHGVSPTAKPVLVAITAREEEEMLVVSVTDTGPGVSRVPEAENHGIGLANVRDRLSARFGPRAHMKSGNGLEGGYCVRLTMPLKRHA